MSKKEQTPQQQLTKLIIKLNNSFARHEYLLEHGGQDPFWPDDVNINLVRNHIIADKNEIKGAFYYDNFYNTARNSR